MPCNFLELLFCPLRCFCLLRWNSWMFLTDIFFSWLECLEPPRSAYFWQTNEGSMCANWVLLLYYQKRGAFVKCSESPTHFFCSTELLSLDTNQAVKFFHTTTRDSGLSFCFANADQNTPVRQGRVQRESVKIQGKRRKTTGSSWPGESSTWLPLKTAAWHLTLVFLPLIKQTRYNMLMSKLLEVQAGGLFNLSWDCGGASRLPLVHLGLNFCLLQI